MVFLDFFYALRSAGLKVTLQQKEYAMVQQDVRQAVDEGTPVVRRHGSVEDAADQWHRAVVRRHDAARGGRLVAHLESL